MTLDNVERYSRELSRLFDIPYEPLNDAQLAESTYFRLIQPFPVSMHARSLLISILALLLIVVEDYRQTIRRGVSMIHRLSSVWRHLLIAAALYRMKIFYVDKKRSVFAKRKKRRL